MSSPSDSDTGEGSSDRAFGLVFAVFFAVVALLPMRQGEPSRPWAWIVAAAFATLALAAPRVLAPLNRLWTRLGLLLHRIMSPLALGIVFYGAVVPTGLVMRLLRRDPLRLRFDPRAPTYWIERTPAGPPPESLKNPF